MDTNRLELEVTAKDMTGAGAASAKRQFQGLEQEAARAAQGMSRAFQQQRDAMGRYMSGAAREATGLGSAMGGLGEAFKKTQAGASGAGDSLAAFERQASAFGTRGIERLRARAEMERKAAGDNEAAQQRISAALGRAEARERSRMATQRQSVQQTVSGLQQIENASSRVASAGAKLSIISIPLAFGAKHAIELSSALEQAKISFTTLLGSSSAADQFVGKLQNFAVRTPFNFTTLVEQSRYLLAQGFKGKEVIPALTAFGNAVAAAGGGDDVLQRVLLQVGQIKSTGRATWEDLKPIAQAGVPIMDILAQSAKKPGETEQKSLDRVREQLKSGSLAAGPTIALIERELMVRYAGSLEKQSQTLGGQLSNLKDQADLTFTAVGDGMKPTVVKFVSGAMSMLASAKSLALGFQQLPQPLKDLAVTAGGLAIAGGPALAFLGSMGTLVGPAVRGWQMLRTAWQGVSGLSLFTNVGGPTLFLNSMQGPLTMGSSKMLMFAAAIGAVTAAFAGWQAGRWIQDATGIGNSVDGFWDKIAGKFGYTTKENAGVAIVGDDKLIIEKMREGLKRKGLKRLPDQGSLDDKTYVGVLKDLGSTFDNNNHQQEDEESKALAKQRAAAGRQTGTEAMRARRELMFDEMQQLAKEPANGELATDANFRERARISIARVNAEISDEIARHKEEKTYTPKVRENLESKRQTLTDAALLKLGTQDNELTEKYYRDRLDKSAKAEDEIKQKRTKAETELFQEGEKADMQRRDLRFQYEQQAADRERELAMQTLESVQAQALSQKLALEDAKLGIEQEYNRKSLDITLRKIQLEQSLEIAKLRAQASIAGMDETDPRLTNAIGSLSSVYSDKAEEAVKAAGAKDIQQAQRTANDKSKLVIEANRKVFENLKQSANGLFDALFSRTQSFGQALKNILKTSVLTPIKDILSNQTAAFFTRILTGQPVTFDKGVTASGPIGKFGGVLNRLGLGQPRIGGTGTIADLKPVNNSMPVWITNPTQGPGAARDQTVNVNHGGSVKVAGVGPGLTAAQAIADINSPGTIVDVWGGKSGRKDKEVVDSVIKNDVTGDVIGSGSTSSGGGFFSNIGRWLGGGSSRRTNIPGDIGGGGFGSGADPDDPRIMHLSDAYGNELPNIAPGVYKGAPTIGDIIKTAGGGSTAEKGNLLTQILGGKFGGLGGKLGKYNGMLGSAGLGLFMDGFNRTGARGTAERVGGAGMAAYGFAGKYLGVMGAAGVGLAADGLRRGGAKGMFETAGGGALIGAKFGGPWGAAIGAAIGLGVGAIRWALGGKSPEDQVQEKIKSAYGINIKEKNILKQIVAIAKQSFGGNYDMAVRSPQVRELVELYANSTGQNMGVQNKLRAVSLSSDQKGLYQNNAYENGRALAFSSGAFGSRTSADIIPGNTGGISATNYNPGAGTSINLSLSPQQTLDVFKGQAVGVIADNPRVVQNASSTAQSGNYQRRETTATQLSPGLLYS